MLEFNILKGQYLNRLDKNVVSADTTDLKAQFELTADFTGTITVWWRRSDKPGITWTSTLSGNQCTIPAETLSAATDNVMYGEYDHFVFVSISDTGRTTSSECEIKVNKSAFSTNATPGTGGSPTAYEELVEQFDELKAENEQFKTDITEQQETFENTVTENVDNIRYVVETETAPPIIEEASGAEITLDDSAYRQVRDLKLYGYSKQIQTTGAQLLDLTSVSTQTINGITYTVNPDYTISVNGTSTALSVLYIPIPLKPTSGTFFLKGCPDVGSVSSFRLDVRDDTSFVIESNYDPNGTTVTLDNVEATKIGIRIAANYTANNLVFKPMFNIGSSALPFEPYTGGYASPSPDWAQPIHSVGDGGSVTVNSVGANLFRTDNISTTVANGATVRNNGDGSFTISGTGVFTGNLNMLKRMSHDETISVVHDGTYTISGGAGGGPYALAKIVSDSESIEINTVHATMSDTFPRELIDDASAILHWGLYGLYNQRIIQQTFYPMLNRGSTPLPWQPYVAPSSALIALTDSLRGIPVTPGGNYTDELGQQWIADYIYRRQTDGRWMIWRNCGRVEYIGGDDENWIYQGGYPRFTTPSGVSNALVTDRRTMVVCNRGLYHQVGSEPGNAFITDGPLFVYSPDPNIDSVDSLKTWLQSNPLEVVYQLATPTIEELPENVQTELNGLYTYNLHTDMWNNDGAYMDLKYVADTKTWINNKIAGLSTAMLNQN